MSLLFDGVTAGPLGEARFQLTAGDTAWLTGEGGTGKTWLLYLAAGLRQPEAGTVRIGDAAPQPGLAAMLFQNPDYQLLETSVMEEVAANAHSPERAEAALTTCEMNPFRGASPQGLSPSQRRRVALASVLATAAPWLLLDTPFAGMTRPEAERLAAGLFAHQQTTGQGLVITGDPVPASRPVGTTLTLERWQRSISDA